MQTRARRTERKCSAAERPAQNRPEHADPSRAAAVALEGGGIRLEARLHAGAVVDVWRAVLPDGRAAAVKLPNARRLSHPGAQRLVRREHEILASLDHPHVVAVLGLVERDGVVALVTELLPGGDLVSLAGAEPRHWLGSARAVADALGAIHAAGYVHADVKARNVLLDADARAKLVDFGGAQPIGRPLPRGGRTPAHLPRRFEFDRAEPALDVFAFAVLLHQLATGRLPGGADGRPGGPPAAGPLTGQGASPAWEALSRTLAAALEAGGAREVPTLLELVDVLESVHCETSRCDGRPARRASDSA